MSKYSIHSHWIQLVYKTINKTYILKRTLQNCGIIFHSINVDSPLLVRALSKIPHDLVPNSHVRNFV